MCHSLAAQRNVCEDSAFSGPRMLQANHYTHTDDLIHIRRCGTSFGGHDRLRRAQATRLS
jgi:hypothetical protein